MANRFEITLRAVDKATAVVRGVNRTIARIVAPIQKIKIAGGHLSRELGLDKLGRGLVNVGRHARDVGQRFASMLTPFTALIGITSLAGVVALGNAWGDVGYKIRQAGIETGIALPHLQALDGAGRLWGVNTEALNGSLVTLGDTLQDALMGRNMQARAFMNQLGISFRYTKEGALDVASSFEDIARAISNPRIANNPPVQRLIARGFGLEAALPLLRQGPDAIKRLTDQVKASGYVMSEEAVAQAEGFRQSLWLLNITAGGLRNTIGAELIPVVQPLVERLTAWIAANREIIGQRVAEVVDALAQAINRVDWAGVLSSIGSFWRGVEQAVEKVGGWGRALIILIGVMNAGTIGAVLGLGASLLKVSWIGSGVFVKSILAIGSALMSGVTVPAGEAAAAVTAIGTAGGGLGVLLKNLGMVGAAAAAGYGVGTLISKLIEGTSVGDTIGAGIAKTLAFFGNDEAQAAVDRMAGRTTASHPAATSPPVSTPYSRPAASATGAPATAATADSATAPGSSGPGLTGRIELLIRGLPDGAAAIVTGGDLPLTVRVDQAMPTGLTP